MPIQTPHDDYKTFEKDRKWARCRDCLGGNDSVKSTDVDTIYLPKLSSQDPDEYKAYKDRAIYYGTPNRTRSSLLGHLFRKPPASNGLESIEDFTNDVTRCGTPIDTFVNDEIAPEVLGVGRVGVLLTLPREEASEVKPYLVPYLAEDIIFWESGFTNGVYQLKEVRLKQRVSVPDPQDVFERVIVNKMLVLKLEDGRYIQETWTENPMTGVYELDEDSITQPFIRGAFLDYIPFVFINTSDNKPDLNEPPLLALCDESINHYRILADFAHGLHFSALPQLVVLGSSEPDEDMTIGSPVAWFLSNPTGGSVDAKYVEFDGTKLMHPKALEMSEKRMSVLGARMLESGHNGGGVEAAEALRIRAGGENSVLGDISNSISTGVMQLLRWAGEWIGVEVSEFEYVVNTDFIDTKINPQELMGIINASNAGLMPMRGVYHNLKQGELLPEDMSFEEFEEMVDVEDNNVSLLNA